MAISSVVESGIQPDETVVVTGQLALAPGSKVIPNRTARQILRSGQQRRIKERNVILMEHVRSNMTANGERERDRRSSKIDIFGEGQARVDAKVSSSQRHRTFRPVHPPAGDDGLADVVRDRRGNCDLQ